MKLYIDTRGRSRGLWRSAPDGARIAAHTDHGVVELEVNPNGLWYVHHGPKVNQAGSFRTVAEGALADDDREAPEGYRPDNMLGNIISVLSDRTGNDPVDIAERIAAEYGDGDFGVAEDHLWNRVGPLCDDIQDELGLEG